MACALQPIHATAVQRHERSLRCYAPSAAGAAGGGISAAAPPQPFPDHAQDAFPQTLNPYAIAIAQPPTAGTGSNRCAPAGRVCQYIFHIGLRLVPGH